MTIYDFISLEKGKQQAVLNTALFIEQYMEDDTTVTIYFLHTFFVELIRTKDGDTEIMPYHRGYKKLQGTLQHLESFSQQLVV